VVICINLFIIDITCVEPLKMSPQRCF